ncbi:hypothetical protein AA0Z99_06285 [Agrococcus sp. 1P02AA]|uniref:hypothetical protein n=1 Tax=Agrococcus sp. 1P02AA TaxID=3132259 RepID=UPI0039A749D3
MSRPAYILALISLFGAFGAYTFWWPEEFLGGGLANVLPLALLLGGAATLTLIYKRTRASRTRSRQPGSVERRASEQASEFTFEVCLVLIAGLTVCLTYAWGGVGFAVGAATLVAAIAAYWAAYLIALRRMTTVA